MQSSRYRLAHNAAEEGNNAGTVGRHWTKAYPNLVKKKKLQKPILCKFTVKCKEWWTPAAAHDSRWASSEVPPGVIQSETVCGRDTCMEEAQNVLLIAPQHFCLYVAHPHERVYVCLHAHTQKEGELYLLDAQWRSWKVPEQRTYIHTQVHTSSISNLISGEHWSCIMHDDLIKSQGCRMSYVIQYEINVKLISGKWQGHYASISFLPVMDTVI